MKCPHCGADNDRVIDSRASHDGQAIRRRRECLACQTRYNTFERVDDPIGCPFCHQQANRVVETHAGEGGFAIRRRRECLVCRRSYTTLERSEQRSIKVVKKDGVRVPFDRQKIKQGLEKACWKRPVSDEQLEQIVSSIETEVHGKFEAEVESSWLGEMLMQHLRQVDQVAYVRFASVYREFQDARDFVEELEPMLAEKRLENRTSPRGDAQPAQPAVPATERDGGKA
ncbi:MAG TPA: transcriptional regulator NrdR [Pirellulales bacterium]|jgi:transcriptional repressor NrdR|nr:transcriptional regulator NrdR [Pirellulales bacterium]